MRGEEEWETYLESLCKWMEEQGMEGIVKKTKYYEGKEVAESRDYLRPNEERRLENLTVRGHIED